MNWPQRVAKGEKEGLLLRVLRFFAAILYRKLKIIRPATRILFHGTVVWLLCCFFLSFVYSSFGVYDEKDEDGHFVQDFKREHIFNFFDALDSIPVYIRIKHYSRRRYSHHEYTVSGAALVYSTGNTFLYGLQVPLNGARIKVTEHLKQMGFCEKTFYFYSTTNTVLIRRPARGGRKAREYLKHVGPRQKGTNITPRYVWPEISVSGPLGLYVNLADGRVPPPDKETVGAFVQLNADDDDNDGVADRDDRFVKYWDNDMLKLAVRHPPGVPVNLDWDKNIIRLYEHPSKKLGGKYSARVGACHKRSSYKGYDDQMVYVEGIKPGSTYVTLTGPGGFSDRLKITVVSKAEIVQTRKYACVESTNNAPFNMTPDSATNVLWKIEPDLGVNGALFASGPTGSGITSKWTGTNVWVSPGLTATNYTLAAFNKDLTNCLDTAALTVIKVKSIKASSTVADNSPRQFQGHKTDFGDPCSATSPNQALIIYHNAVVNANYQVQDFDVNFKATILPSSVTVDQLSETWAKVEGPTSGNMNRTDAFEVKHQNPKEGGLYKFEFDLNLGCAKSGANLLLPLAGADMTTWLDTETKAVEAWAAEHRTATETANYSRIPGVTMYNVYRTWCSISGSFFDYVFDSVDDKQHAPCRRFQSTIGPNGQYGYVTVNGVVVHGSKINNMMWALFGKYWGWSETCLRLGAHLNQVARNLRIDGTTSQNAIGFGDDIHDNPSANIITILTQSNLRTLQDPSVLIEEKLWPSPNPADAGNSTFARPTLPTTP